MKKYIKFGATCSQLKAQIASIQMLHYPSIITLTHHIILFPSTNGSSFVEITSMVVQEPTANTARATKNEIIPYYQLLINRNIYWPRFKNSLIKRAHTSWCPVTTTEMKLPIFIEWAHTILNQFEIFCISDVDSKAFYTIESINVDLWGKSVHHWILIDWDWSSREP